MASVPNKPTPGSSRETAAQNVGEGSISMRNVADAGEEGTPALPETGKPKKPGRRNRNRNTRNKNKKPVKIDRNKEIPTCPDLIATARIDTAEHIDRLTCVKEGVYYHRIVAKSPVPPGTRVVGESAAITLPAPGDNLDDIYKAFLDLPRDKQDLFMQLTPGGPVEDEVTRYIDTLLEMYLGLHAKGNNRTEQMEATYKDLESRLPLLFEKWRVAARFIGNRYSLLTTAMPAREKLPADTPVTGLFLSAGFFRHSCVPNCYAQYNHQKKTLTVHTTRAIAEDDELTISAIGSQVWYNPAEVRAQMLLDAANIICECPACDPKHPGFQKHETTRRKLHGNVAFLGCFMTTVDSEQNTRMYTRGTDQALNPAGGILNRTPLSEFEEAEKKALEVITALDKIGCADLEVVRWRNALKNVILPTLGKTEAAFVQSLLALRGAKKCLGDDNPEVWGLEEDARSLEKATKEEKKSFVGGKGKMVMGKNK